MNQRFFVLVLTSAFLFGFGPHSRQRISTGFIFFGDFGKGNQEQLSVAKTLERHCQRSFCDFTLLLGDNFYPFGVTSETDLQWNSKFEKPYAGIKSPFYAVLGNHDYMGNIQAQMEYSKKHPRWIMPNRYYTFSKNNVDFFAIDTENFDRDQLIWLEEALLRSNKEWKIVFGHHPVYSYGIHGDTNDLTRRLLPTLKKFQVDFYLSGHDHDLQYILRDSLNFVVSGAAAETRPVSQGPYSLFAASKLGFVRMDIENKAAEINIIDEKGHSLFKHVVTH